MTRARIMWVLAREWREKERLMWSVAAGEWEKKKRRDKEVCKNVVKWNKINWGKRRESEKWRGLKWMQKRRWDFDYCMWLTGRENWRLLMRKRRRKRLTMYKEQRRRAKCYLQMFGSLRKIRWYVLLLTSDRREKSDGEDWRDAGQGRWNMYERWEATPDKR